MKTIEVPKSEFKPKAFAYFRQVEEQHETILITDHGKAVVDIVPHQNFGKQDLQSMRGLVSHYDNPFEPINVKWDASE